MNIFVAIMLVFALIGFIDKLFNLKWGLSETFDRGFLTMGSLSISIVGIYCVGLTFMSNNIEFFKSINDYLFFDSSILIGSVLCPDMGGYPIVSQISQDASMILFSGILLTSLLGQTITFQLPIFLAFVKDQEISTMMRGFIVGIVVVPVGLLLCYPMIELPLNSFIINLLPIVILCIVIAIMVIKIPQITIKILSTIANAIKALSYILFLIVIVGLYIPELQYVETSLVEECCLMILKMIVIISGSMILSDLILKYGSAYIQKIADKLKVNKESIIGFVLNCASSLAMLPLYSKMDKKGKLLNAAFSVSGAYLFGGQLAFVSNVANDSIMTYVFAKLLCGILSVILMSFIYERTKEND